jgi:transmembrane sensor
MNSQIVDEAAQWFVTLRDGGGDAAQRARFAQWLLESPAHVRTYLELTSIWAEAASVDPERRLSVQALLTRARADANVVELDERPSAVPPRRRAPARVRFTRRYGIAASLAAVAIAAVSGWALTRSTVYTTGIGEQRSIALPDGSRVELNARSRLRVRFSRAERTIDLVEGQGLFTVAKEPRRPFIVRSGDTRVRAVGTEFDIYRKPSGTVVTVVEGRVEIGTAIAAAALPAEAGAAGPPERHGDSPARDRTIQLAAGEQATVAAHAIARVARPDIEAATAWTQRQLVFDSAALVDVAAEFNRYNFKRLVIRDAELDSFPISGVFSSADPDSLVQFLREQPEIAIEQTDTEVTLSRKIR